MDLITLNSKLNYYYHDFWNEFGANEVNSLPLLTGGPWKTIIIVLVYLWFVKYKGPEMMKNREPYDVKIFILAHNIFLVALHTILFPFGIWASNFGVSLWQCKRLNLNDKEEGTKFWIGLLLCYIYFLTKFLELFDTIFFILRKKNSHVTTLHVFHHSSMPLFCYLGIKFSPWFPTGWVAFLNAFVHIVMYSYYTLALLNVQNLMWMKKYITQMQIVQFLLILLHGAYFLLNKECEWPKIFNILQLIHGMQFLYLFSAFYVKTYWRKVDKCKVMGQTKNEIQNKKVN